MPFVYISGAVAGEELTIPEVARLLGLSEGTVHGLAAKGELPAYGWPLRVRRAQVNDYIERQRIKPGGLGRGSNQYQGRPERGVAEWYRGRYRRTK